MRLTWVGEGGKYAPLRGSFSETVEGSELADRSVLGQKRTLPGSRGLLYFHSETVLGCND